MLSQRDNPKVARRLNAGKGVLKRFVPEGRLKMHPQDQPSLWDEAFASQTRRSNAGLLSMRPSGTRTRSERYAFYQMDYVIGIERFSKRIAVIRWERRGLARKAQAKRLYFPYCPSLQRSATALAAPANRKFFLRDALI